MEQRLYPNLILEALSNVRYPGSPKNIVEANMVADDIRIEGNKVSFSLVFDKPNSPFIKSVVKASETAITTFIGSWVDIKGNISVKTPEVTPEIQRPVLDGVKNTIAIFSGKGGVGKSTVSSNLAVSLARKGFRVGLLDADIFGPSIPKMFGCEDFRPILEEVNSRELITPAERCGVKLLSIGFFVDTDSPIIWRGTMAGNALQQLITEGNWGELDYLLIDMPPGTSDIHLTLVQSLALTGAVVVTTPQAVALADAIKGIGMFAEENIQVPVLGLIENMSWFTPLELPGNKYYIFGKGGGVKLAARYGIPLLGQLPLIQGICDASDEGIPIVANEKETETSRYFDILASNLVEATDKRNKEKAPTKKVEVTR